MRRGGRCGEKGEEGLGGTSKRNSDRRRGRRDTLGSTRRLGHRRWNGAYLRRTNSGATMLPDAQERGQSNRLRSGRWRGGWWWKGRGEGCSADGQGGGCTPVCTLMNDEHHTRGVTSKSTQTKRTCAFWGGCLCLRVRRLICTTTRSAVSPKALNL